MRNAVKKRKVSETPTLSWAVHRDLAKVFGHWRKYVKRVGADAFALLIVLEAIRLDERSSDTFRYADLRETLGISPATLRRRIGRLRAVGFLSMTTVAGSNRTEAKFRIHVPPRKTRGGMSAHS